MFLADTPSALTKSLWAKHARDPSFIRFKGKAAACSITNASRLYADL